MALRQHVMLVALVELRVAPGVGVVAVLVEQDTVAGASRDG